MKRLIPRLTSLFITFLLGLLLTALFYGKNTIQIGPGLIIWERITSGDIQFEGKGYQVTDDLFTVSGRANWILRNLAKKNFGHVRPSSSAGVNKR